MKYILLAMGTTDISVIAIEFVFRIYVLSTMLIESMMR